MVDRQWRRVAFRAAFALYLAWLLSWLALGLLPTLAAGSTTVRGWIAAVAAHPHGLGPAAGRILHPSMAMIGTGEALQQYAFSALNLALGLLLVARRPDQREPRLLAFALLGTAATFNMPSHRAFHITGSPWPVAFSTSASTSSPASVTCGPWCFSRTVTTPPGTAVPPPCGRRPSR